MTQAPDEREAIVCGISKAHIKLLWEKTHGKAWEPRDYRHPFIDKMIRAGFLERCTMRFGFEAFDTGVDWTPAGRIAAKAIQDGDHLSEQGEG